MLTGAVGADGGVLGRGARGAVPGGGDADDARERRCGIREYFCAVGALRAADAAWQVPHEAFIAATKVVKKQITPEVLLRYQRFQEAV